MGPYSIRHRHSASIVGDDSEISPSSPVGGTGVPDDRYVDEPLAPKSERSMGYASEDMTTLSDDASDAVTILLQNDVKTMPGSPWATPRKRKVSVPRATSPLDLANYAAILGLMIALGWVFYLFIVSCLSFTNVGQIIIEIILAVLSFFAILWNTYYSTSAVVKCFIPAKAFRENGMYYSIVPEEKHEDDEWLPVTIQIPVYKESFEEVIEATLKSCMQARDHYRLHTSAKCNIVVCDDGIMAFLKDKFEVAEMLWDRVSASADAVIDIIGAYRRSFPLSATRLLDDLAEEDMEEVIRRMKFYAECDIGFVARSTVDRRGKFKKASNLNAHLRVVFGARQRQEEDDLTWEEAVEEVTRDEIEGNRIAMVGNDIQVGALICVSDADGRMAPSVIMKTVPEFLNDETIGFTQHSTKTMDSQRGESFYLKMIEVYTDALYQGHFMLSSIMGCHPPLVGHSMFIRTEAIRQCGRMRTLRSAQRWLNNIGLKFLGANAIDSYYLQCPIRTEYWSESHVSEDFELMIHFYNMGYKGRYVAFPDCEFQEGVTRTFDEEATRHRKFSVGAHELLFNPLQDIPGHGIFTSMFRTFLTCSLPSYYKIYLAAYLLSYLAGGVFIFIYVITAIFRMASPEAKLSFASSPIAVIVLNIIVYYLIGYTAFIVSLLRMHSRNISLFFTEYRHLSKLHILWKHVRYGMVFQFLFYFPIGNMFFLGGLDHMLSRSRICCATNKDSIHETEWTAIKKVVAFNWGSWLVAAIVAGLAVGPLVMFPDSVENYLFSYPALLMSAMAIVVPFVLNPFVWPCRRCSGRSGKANKGESSASDSKLGESDVTV